MNLGKVQKMILLILTIGFTLFGIAFVVSVLFVERTTFNFRMLFPMALGVLGVFSTIFHIKTIEAYSVDFTSQFKFPKVPKLFWILNALNGLLILVIGLMLSYFFYDSYDSEIRKQDDIEIFILVIAIPLIAGVWIALDIYKLFQMEQKVKEKQAFNSIDDISGMDNK